jgi:uncharacterized protein (TIGR02328 family)
MRLWHESLIPHLPRQQLLGQHRECCALRGKGWGRPHATVNYVFKHRFEKLVAYHFRVIDEMEKRGYEANSLWRDAEYRGKKLGYISNDIDIIEAQNIYMESLTGKQITIYPEHNDEYLQECLDNLRSKGIEISL